MKVLISFFSYWTQTFEKEKKINMLTYNVK